MSFNDSFIVVGCPLSPTFRADARTIGMLEAWRAKNVVTYYPASGAAEVGYDKIVSFAQSIEPKPTHILFVDYDVLPKSNTLKKLIEHDKDVVCGVYPAIQTHGLKWCVSRTTNDEKFDLLDIDALPDNPFKANVGANGMLLVKMEVFNKLKWPYWKTVYGEDRVKKGADIYFFEKLKDAGYDIWVDPKIKCGHFRMVDLLGIANQYVLKGQKQ